MRVARVTRIEDFMINGTYMFIYNGTLERGRCNSIHTDGVSFDIGSKIVNKKFNTALGKLEYFAIYDETIYKKFYEYKQEYDKNIRTLLLSGKDLDNVEITPADYSIKAMILSFLTDGKNLKRLSNLCLLGILLYILVKIAISIITMN